VRRGVLLPPASTPVLAILGALVEERTGLHYGLLDHAVLAEKAGVRAAEAGFESLLDYYYYLRYDAGAAAEMDALVDALVVCETYFFRELPPLQALVDEVEALVARGARPRIWSAACATGEEPLTLAMLLDARGLLGEVDLVASDISARALDRARRGRHGPRSLRDGAPPALVERYLHREPDGSIRVAGGLAEAITWRRVNLQDPAQVAAVGIADAVVCRNVLIYFSDETAVRVVERLSAALHRGGLLLVGISESLLRFGTNLLCEEHGNVFLYRRPA
jgi:chemotaxis protein methyltransferase CheR